MQRGNDTGTTQCAAPSTTRYLFAACVPGNATWMGNDSTLATCSQLGEWEPEGKLYDDHCTIWCFCPSYHHVLSCWRLVHRLLDHYQMFYSHAHIFWRSTKLSPLNCVCRPWHWPALALGALLVCAFLIWRALQPKPFLLESSNHRNCYIRLHRYGFAVRSYSSHSTIGGQETHALSTVL